ncbi:MAG: hypothetical protein WC895_01620 [Candidatus Shapirobacteria bacterium]|jgi:hypothetical protein
MVAGVDYQTNISIFFKQGEIEALSKGQKIAGILIRKNNPHQQGLINVQVDNDKENLNGFGIGIEDKKYWGIKENFELDIFIGNYYFGLLQERGRIGTRHSLLDGSDITLYNNLDDFNTRNMVDNLEFYKDNKEEYKKLTKSKQFLL